jgi:hypothetical protein
MTALLAACRELTGLFVDDGALAFAIIAVVLLAALSTALLPNTPLAAGGILLLGCPGALLANLTRARSR